MPAPVPAFIDHYPVPYGRHTGCQVGKKTKECANESCYARCLAGKVRQADRTVTSLHHPTSYSRRRKTNMATAPSPMYTMRELTATPADLSPDTISFLSEASASAFSFVKSATTGEAAGTTAGSDIDFSRLSSKARISAIVVTSRGRAGSSRRRASAPA